MKSPLIVTVLAIAFACSATVTAQNYKMTTPIAPGVAVPDRIDSSIGTLNSSYGYPDEATIQKIYDNLDRSRAAGVPNGDPSGESSRYARIDPPTRT